MHRWMIVLIGWTSAAPAWAFSYESPVSDGCHERITIRALRAARAALPGLGSTDEGTADAALIRDVPFVLPEEMDDIETASLLIGVRDPDLRGLSGTDTTQLANIHNDEHGQVEHCLRTSGQDEPDGSREAIDACRELVFERAMYAIDRGLDVTGAVDLDERTITPVSLAIAGRTFPELPVFYVHMGRALHTLQDSFTHAFRTDDLKRVTVVLNWIDFSQNRLNERFDGPPHMTKLDQCEGIDAYRRRRIDVAGQASKELLIRALDPDLSRAQKEVAIDALLREFMTHEAGCTFQNSWCDAPERAYEDRTGCGCRGGGQPEAFVLGAIGLTALAWRRRRGRRAT